MRGADAYSESLFSKVRLEDLVPATYPLRPIRMEPLQPWSAHCTLGSPHGPSWPIH